MLLILLLILIPTLAIADEPVVNYTGDPAPKFLDEWNAFTTTHPSFLQPVSLAAGPDGVIYILDWEHGNVLRFQPDGSYIDKWNVPGTFHRPNARSLNAIAVSDRMVYVSDLAGECIHQFTPEGRHKGTLPYSAKMNGLAVDPLGNLYVSGTHVTAVDTVIAPQPEGSKSPPDTVLQEKQFEGPRLWKLNRMGDVLQQWDRGVGPVAIDGRGTLLVVTEMFPRGPVSILRLDPTGGRISEWELKQLGQGAYSRVNGMAVDARGHVFLTSAELHKIVELDEAGNWTRAWNGAGPDHRPLMEPVGTAVDTSGCLYVTDWAVSRVVKYDPRKAP